MPSRWQHDQVPAWLPVPAEVVCEVRFTTLDGVRWLRIPATFVRWRPERSPDDCDLDQLTLR
jgi:ATP-dependent DNA ligase